ncbi:hypothetical protein ACVI1L_007172 [Bradyrhizobium sp. USDA 4516]
MDRFPIASAPPVNPMVDYIRRQNNQAGNAQERLLDLIHAYQSRMSDDAEIGISVVGSAASFRLRAISVSNPDILIFDGIDDNGNEVRLLQHHSQMAVLLVSMPKLGAEPAFRMGFT